MKSFLLALCLLLSLSTSNALLRRIGEKQKKPVVLSAGPKLPVKYIQGGFEEQAPEESYVIPEYKEATPEKVNPSVTEGFCRQMLNDVKAKKAPYWLEGKFTGESRTEIIEQCGNRICTWGQEMAKASSQCGVECPTKCNTPKPFVSEVLNNEEALATFIKSLLVLFPDPKSNAVASVKVATKAKTLIQKATESNQATSVQELKAPPAAPETARFKGVTKEFCQTLLKKVQNKEAPYFIKDHETGVDIPTKETRSTIIRDCTDRVCDFMNKYKAAKGGSECPENCNQSSLQKLANAKHLLPLLTKIIGVIEAQPEAPPAVEEVTTPVEQEKTIEEQNEAKIAANDPRDPKYQK